MVSSSEAAHSLSSFPCDLLLPTPSIRLSIQVSHYNVLHVSFQDIRLWAVLENFFEFFNLLFGEHKIGWSRLCITAQSLLFIYTSYLKVFVDYYYRHIFPFVSYPAFGFSEVWFGIISWLPSIAFVKARSCASRDLVKFGCNIFIRSYRYG